MENQWNYLFLRLIVKIFHRLYHGQLDLDILFVKLTIQIWVLLLKNPLCTLFLRVGDFIQCLFLTVIFCKVPLLRSSFRFAQLYVHKCFVGMRGRSGGVSLAWWHVRTALRFALWDQWQKGSVYDALSWLPYFWDLHKQEQKGVGMLKSHQLEVAMPVTKGGLFSQGRPVLIM